jgi:hypothetical protein
LAARTTNWRRSSDGAAAGPRGGARCARFVFAALIALQGLCLAMEDAIVFQHVTVDADGPRNPHVKAVGDLNGDGRDELVVASSAGGPLVWYDLVTLRRHEIAPKGKWSCDARLVDMDRDGHLDLVISEWYGENRMEWYENPLPEGDPAAGPWKRHIIGPPRGHDVCVADLDGDGRPDIVTRQQGAPGNTIVIRRSAGPDAWEQRTLSCPEGEGLAIGDLTGDGRPDIVIGGAWYEAPSDVMSGEWRRHEFAKWFPDAVVRVADVNGDGRLEIVLSRSEGKGRVSWFERPRDLRALWIEHVVDDSVDYAHSLQVCDLNGDGAPDIVAAEMHQSERRRVLVYLNEGGGRSWRREVVAETGSHNMWVADLGDRGKALVGANWSGPYQPVEMWRLVVGD